MGEELLPEEKAEAQAVQLLKRYGIVAREFYRREELLPWPLIASELQRMEMRGEIRRGYFVEGLSGMQFASPAAFDELRRVRAEQNRDEQPIIVNACDPANPFGGGVRLPLMETQPSRISSNYIAFHAGTPVLLIESNGARLHTIGESVHIQSALKQFISMIRLPDALRPFKEIIVEHCNGQRPAQSPIAITLTALGFRKDSNQTMRYDGYA